MNFDRIMDFLTYVILGATAIGFIFAALSIFMQIRALDEELDSLDGIEYLP